MNSDWRNNSLRKRRGSSLFEAVCSIALALPFILFLMDGVTLVSTIQLNETTCAQACRAASMVSPDAITPGKPSQAASLVMQKLNNLAILSSSQFSVSERLTEPLPTKEFGGPVVGEVKICSKVKVMLPFSCNFLRCGPLTLKATRVQPYTWVRPRVTGAISNVL